MKLLDKIKNIKIKFGKTESKAVVAKKMEQSIFNYLAFSLIKQGERCCDETSVFYKHPTKDHCFCPVGFLLNINGSYNSNMDNAMYPLHILMKKFPNSIPEYFNENVNLLLTFQALHDNEHTWTSGKVLYEGLCKIAKEFSLNTSFLDKTVKHIGGNIYTSPEIIDILGIEEYNKKMDEVRLEYNKKNKKAQLI